MIVSSGQVSGQDVLLPFGSDGWDYFVGSAAPSDPINAWREAGFVLPPLPDPLPDPLVGVWLSGGTAPIGYGSGAKGVATEVPTSDVNDGNYSTLYCLNSIDIADPGALTQLTLNTEHDDGFVLYLNGVEAARNNVAAGDEDIFDSTATGGHEYDALPNSFDLSGAIADLVAGENLLAIEVKNVNLTSSDILMNIQILGSTEQDVLCPTGATCSRNADGATISWVNNPAANYTAIAVTRDGTPIAGSPFAGDTESVLDPAGNGVHSYEVIASIDDFDCPALSCSTTSQVCLIDIGDDWSYFKGTEEPSPDGDGLPTTGWTDAAFDDSLWTIGASGIGYGDGDDTTVLDDMEDLYSSVYLRATFNATAQQAGQLTLNIDYDDAFIAYLNGQEVVRSASMGGAPGDVHAANELANGQREAGAVEDYAISADAVNVGSNTLAIVGFNATLGSSDLSLLPKISVGGVRCPDAGDITCERTAEGGVISWVNHPAGSYDEISVTRDGVPIAGSPFAGDTESVTDPTPGDASDEVPVVYEVIHSSGADTCDSLTCELTDNAVVLCEEGDEWSYFKGTEEPSPDGDGLATADWAAVNFDDGAWPVGASGFGYGDGDDTTDLDDMVPVADDPDTPDVDESNPGYSTVYVRKDFDVIDLADVTGLALRINYDDGFVAYFNGVEFARSNVPADEVVTFDSLANANHEAGTAETYLVPSGEVVEGTNVIAVQGLNTSFTSSDFSLIPELVVGVDIPLNGVACVADDVDGSVTISWNASSHDSYEVTRNGVAIAGSPFGAGTTQVVDSTPEQADNLYAVTGISGENASDPVECTVDCDELFPDVLTCTLSLADDGKGGQVTRADLTWTIDPPGTAIIDVRRENLVVESLPAGSSEYADPNVEAFGPEDDVDYDVQFLNADGDIICELSCSGISLCPENLVCVPSGASVELTWENVVKEWVSYTISRDGEIIAADVPGDATSYTDDTADLLPGVSAEYTLTPVAPAGEEAVCDVTCTAVKSIPELAKYTAPNGGWDYSIDFGPGDDQYNPNTLQTGNLDGDWIRAADDMWDGSAPLDVGAAPDGDRPGGIGVESLAGGLGECGDGASVLRILDPGNPGDPGGSLAAEHPDAYNAPDNSRFARGYATGVADRNLLRDGVTIAGRFRINPDAPEYLNATANGDGSPITAGLGQLGIHFADDGTLGTGGAPASLSVNLNSGDVMQMSTAPLETMDGTSATIFRSFWVTIEDPEDDDTYDVTFYINGNDTPFVLFGSVQNVALQAATFDFGAGVGNFLVISMPSEGNDGDVQVDWFAYKEGVHLPSTMECEPCENNAPSADIAVTPGTTVELVDASVDVTLDGSGSDDGDGGAQGLVYSWTKISGPGGDSIADDAAESTTVTFTAAGVYTYRLAVNDRQDCNFNDTAFVTVTVESACDNAVPNAVILSRPGTSVDLDAGAAQVTLDGSDSDDGDGGAQGLTYAWAKTSGPAGDSINSPNGDSTIVQFTAAGSYVFEVVVDDGQDCNNTDSARITITVNDAACPNTTPTASAVATPDTVTIEAGMAELTLDGSGSDDGDGGAQGLSYSWTKTSGPAGETIETPSADMTNVVFTNAGDYEFQLMVDDGENCNNTAVATVNVTVNPEIGDEPQFIRGDGDNSGSLALTDGIKVFNYLFTGVGGEPTCFDALDSNDSGDINLTDGINILNVLFLGIGNIAAPAGACGIDPTPDTLPACVDGGCP